MIKVSIIIPVYNTEKFLCKCIDSLLNQTLSETQLIFVDDGSTDQSLSILKEYKNKHPEKIELIVQTNQGQAAARNNAMKIAKGEYIGFVDSDDWTDENMYEKMYDIAKSKDLEIVICDMVDHYPDRIVYHNSSQFDSKFTVTPSACNKIFKRDFISSMYFPTGLWYEDFQFTTINLLRTKRIGTVNEGFYNCHVRAISTMSNDNSNKNLDMVTVLKNIKSFMMDENIYYLNKSVFNYLVVDHILISTINRVASQDNPRKEKVIKILRNYAKEEGASVKRAKEIFDIPLNRVFVAYLNYSGLHNTTKKLLKIKAKLKGDKE